MKHFNLLIWFLGFTITLITSLYNYYLFKKSKNEYLKYHLIFLSVLLVGTIFRFIVFYFNVNFKINRFPGYIHIIKALMDGIILYILPLMVDYFFFHSVKKKKKILFFIGSILFVLITIFNRTIYYSLGTEIYRKFYFIFIALYCCFFLLSKRLGISNKKEKVVTTKILLISFSSFFILLILHLIYMKYIHKIFYFTYLVFIYMWNFISFLYFSHLSTIKSVYDIAGQQLTDREKEIIFYLKKGLTNKEIAKKLYISFHTVKNHITNISSKLGGKTKMQIISLFNQLENK